MKTAIFPPSRVSLAAMPLALLLAPISMAQETTGALDEYAAVDANQDRSLTEAEFRPFVDRTHDAWGTDADALLDEREIAQGVFGYRDADKDTIVTREDSDRG